MLCQCMARTPLTITEHWLYEWLIWVIYHEPLKHISINQIQFWTAWGDLECFSFSLDPWTLWLGDMGVVWQSFPLLKKQILHLFRPLFLQPNPSNPSLPCNHFQYVHPSCTGNSDVYHWQLPWLCRWHVFLYFHGQLMDFCVVPTPCWLLLA